MKFDETFLPENWKLVDLPDLVFFQEGPGVRKHQFTENGVKLINVKNIVDNKLVIENTETHISEEEAKGRYSHFLVDEGDLIIASSGIKVDYFHKKIAFVEKKHIPLCMNTSTIRFKSLNSTILDISYFKHFMKTPFFAKQVQFHITGSAQLNFGPSHLKKMKVVLPPIETQKKIVEILENAEKLKEWRAEADELANEYLKSVFLEMFGDPVKNRKGWDLFKFGDVGKLERGKSKHRPRNAPELLGGPYPLIQTGEVAGSGGYIKNYTQTYSEIGLKQSRMWPKGTLCITIAANIAKTGILTFDACFPDSIVGFTPNKHVKVEYVQHWISFLQKILEDRAPESAQKNINLKILSNLEIPIPPLGLQEKFVEISEKLNQLKTYQFQSKQEIDNLFNTLMQKAFKGELVC